MELDLEQIKNIDVETSVLGWILKNKIINERGDPIEFYEHNFLIQPYADWHPKQVCMKSAQVGFTVMEIIKSFYAALYRNWTIIFTQPTADDIRDFVPSKVDAIANSNLCIREQIFEVDGQSKKKVGNNFIFYRGTHGKQEAVSITADLNIHDELDLSVPKVVDLYKSRLQKSKYKGEWHFSNPVRPSEFGISNKYEASDCRHWMIECSRCNHEQALDYWKNVDKKKEVFICAKCKKELSEEDRHDGQWIAEYPERSNDVHGYHINQLMASWVTAKDLIYTEKNSAPETFYTMFLGLPYIEKDDTVDIETIGKNITTESNSMLRNALGVDVGFKSLHYVLGNHEGVFKIGIASSWDEIEDLIRKYKPITVADANPDPYPRLKLMPKYPGEFFCCFYRKDREKKNIFTWGSGETRGHVYADRSPVIQSLVNDLIDGKFPFCTNGRTKESYLENELQTYLKHWSNIYKVVEKDSFDIPHSNWKNTGADHFVHASVYFKIALSKVQKIELERQNPPDGFFLSHDLFSGRIPAEKIPQFVKEDTPDHWKYI